MLAIDGNTYQERYQRYYFKDIQALTIRLTNRGKILNGALILATLLTAIITFSVYQTDPTIETFSMGGIIGGLFSLILIVNLIQGPTCICHIKTPISLNLLPSLHRLRTAKKAIARISPMIEQHQGVLTPDVAAQLQAQRPAPHASVTPPEKMLVGEKIAATTSQQHAYNGWAHWALATGLLLTAAYCVSYLYLYGVFMASLGLIMAGGLLTVAIIAMSKQVSTSLSTWLKSVPWFVVASLFIGAIAGYFAAMLNIISSGQIGPYLNQWAMVTSLAEQDPFAKPFFAGALIFYALSYLLAAGYAALS
ncbi:MAG: hypothetical protein OET90_10185, partial [Desulfuromonadales bacterium]|nr:hypothetical protein [Desulfuromonadales bacterium]